MSHNEQSGYINPELTPEQIKQAILNNPELAQIIIARKQDIADGKNLEMHTKNLKEEIEELNKRIALEEAAGNKTDGFKDLKNACYQLLYEISLHEDSAK